MKHMIRVKFMHKSKVVTFYCDSLNVTTAFYVLTTYNDNMDINISLSKSQYTLSSVVEIQH